MAIDTAAFVRDSADPRVSARRLQGRYVRVQTSEIEDMDHSTLARLLRHAAIRLAMSRGTNENAELHRLMSLDLAIQDLLDGTEGVEG